jgi:SAM-dependent methyltransferase
MQKGADEMSGSMDEIARVISSAKVFNGVLAAVEEGVLDVLTETSPVPLDTLASATGTLPGPLRSLLRGLAGAGLVQETAEGWSLSKSGARLSPSHPRSAHPLLKLQAWGVQSHVNLAGVRSALRGRRNPTEVPDSLVPTLASAMRVGASIPSLFIGRVPELRSARHLVDVCAGPAQYAVVLCRMHRDLRVTALDREPMITSARRLLEAEDEGLAARVDTVAWDLHSDPIPVDIDAALVSHVLHLLDGQARVDLLRRIADRMDSGGVLLLHDFLAPDVDGGVIIDWLTLGACFDLSLPELAAEVENSGFELLRASRIAEAGTSLVVARRP